MRPRTLTTTSLSLLSILFTSTIAHPSSDLSPFTPAFLDFLDPDTSYPSANLTNPLSSEAENNAPSNLELRALQKRSGGCPNNYNSCSTLAAADAGACCSTNAVCSLDSANQVACCPIGSACTGTISVNIVSTTATTTGSSSSSSTTGLVILGGSTTSTATATATNAGSYVANSYFPFPVVATSFADSAACTSAYSACQTDYALCTSDLAGSGSGFGVTVSAPNGGVTVAGVQSLGVASATSICSSLATQAGCAAVQTSNCSSYKSATETSTAGFVVGTTSPGRKGVDVRREGVMGAMVVVGVIGGLV